MNSIFWFSYSLSSILFGLLIKRFRAILFITIGMYLSCLSYCIVGILSFFEEHNIVSYIILMGLNGMGQAIAFSGFIVILGNTF